MIAVNRLTPIFEELAQTPSRTPAQQAASRQNGARSHGPVTLAGKNKSRLNGLHHGLLARVVAPPADLNGSDKLYRRVRQELLAEFKPGRFTERAGIDTLAIEYVNLARVIAIQESLHRPPGLCDDDIQAWQKIVERRRLLKQLEGLLTRLKGGQNPDCSLPAANRIARNLTKLVGKIQVAVAKIAEEQAAVEAAASETPAADPDDHDDLEEDRRWLELGQIVAGPGLQLHDQETVARVLSGRLKLSPADRQRLIVLLNHSRGIAANLVAYDKSEYYRIKLLHSSHVMTLAQSPEKLLLLVRYRAKVEHSIDRKLKQLRCF